MSLKDKLLNAHVAALGRRFVRRDLTAIMRPPQCVAAELHPARRDPIPTLESTERTQSCNRARLRFPAGFLAVDFLFQPIRRAKNADSVCGIATQAGEIAYPLPSHIAAHHTLQPPVPLALP